MAHTWNREFLDRNGQRSYPLADTATQQDLTGAIALPESFLVGLYFPVPAAAAIDPDLFYLQKLTVAPTGYVLAVGYDDGSPAPPTVATATASRALHTEHQAYPLRGVGDLEDCVGRVVLGRTHEVDQLTVGTFTFDRGGGQLDPDCIRPVPRGVSRLVLIQNGQASTPIVDQVELVAGTGTTIRAASALDPGGLVTVTDLTLDAYFLPGDATVEPETCADQAGLPPPIRSINGVTAVNDDLSLLSSACTHIVTGLGQIQIDDICSEPCCGCAELEQLAAEVKHLRDQAEAFRQYALELRNLAESTQNALTASRMDGGGCVTCE